MLVVAATDLILKVLL